MLNINIKKEDVRVKVSDLEVGEFFLFENSFGREDLCQILLSGDRIKTEVDFPIAFVYTKTGEVDLVEAGALVTKVDVEINVALSR